MGEISGAVTDETGAAIAGAKVTARNTGTGETREFETGASGTYVIPQLIPGAYQVTAERTGFRRFVRSGVVLQVGQRAQVDAVLPVGSVSESVEVTAEVPLLETTDASLGQVIENRKILELPLNGRNIVGMAALIPGVIPGSGFGMGVPDGRAALIQAATANLVVNGGISAHNDVLVDGIPLSVCCQNQIAFVPSIDTTEEFRVRTNLYDAQFGRSSGGIISYASKSGTNELHGSLYEFLRNDNLDANNFFNNRAGIRKGHFVYNQFGGRIGGPIVRDKTFFFANYEGVRNRRANFLTGNVPTPEQLSGVFTTGVYDPLTVRREGANFIRDAFPGNRIPSSRFDPVAVSLSKLWPQPNAAGANNFISNASANDTENQLNARIDHHLSSRTRLFGRYSYNKNDGGLPDWFGNIASPNVFTQQIRNHNAVIEDTFTASPNLLLTFRYGLTRQSNIRAIRSAGTDLTQFGWPSSFNSARQDEALPKIDLAGILRLSSNSLFQRIGEVHAGAAQGAYIRGRHSLKAGAEYRVYRTNWADNGNAAGTFGFNNGFTRGPDAQRATNGTPVASFLLGYPASGNIAAVETIAAPQTYSALFLQDDFRVNQRLTVNLGLRWEVETPRKERYDRLSFFNPDIASPLAAQTGIAGLSGGLQFPNRDGYSRNQQDIDWNNFGPRFGFAWSPRAKVAVRGGYGLMFVPITSRYVSNSTQGFSATTNFFSSVDGVTPVGRLSNPFPNGITSPPGASAGLLTGVGTGFGTLLRNEPVGYTQQWSLSAQYEFHSSLLMDVAYSGSKGTRLPVVLPINVLPTPLLAQGTALLTQTANPFRGFVPTGPLTGANTTRLQLLRPYPQFLNLTSNLTSLGSSTYHALEMKVNKRLSRGFSILGAFTAGKILTDTSPFLTGFLDANPGFQDVYNRRLDRAIATQDISRRLAISYVWELPWGWQLNGITTFQSGQPLVLGNAIATTSGATRPHNNGASARKTGPVDQRLNQYFDTSVFRAPGPFEFGTTGRTLPDVRSDGTRNFDISLFKNFKIRERYQMQFRTEFFNIFNTPRFDAPNGTFGNVNFGVVGAQDNNPRDIQLALRFSF